MNLDQLAARLEAAERQLAAVERRTSNIPARWPGATGGGGVSNILYHATALEPIMYGGSGDVLTDHDDPQTIEVDAGRFEVPKDVRCVIGKIQSTDRWEVVVAPTWYALMGPLNIVKGAKADVDLYGSQHTVRAKYGALSKNKWWGVQWTPNDNTITAVGPTAATTVADDAAIAGTAWTNPNNARSHDLNEASNTGAASHYLRATFGGIALGATTELRGIQISVERRQAGTCEYIDQSARLCIAGAATGDDKATTTPWTNTSGYVYFGGETDLWGLSAGALLAALNAGTLGFALAGKQNGPGTIDARVDAMRIKIWYRGPNDGDIPPIANVWLGTELEC